MNPCGRVPLNPPRRETETASLRLSIWKNELSRDIVVPPDAMETLTFAPVIRARIERVMAAMAPDVSRPIAGDCPACGATVEAPLHVARVVVGELRRAAAAVHDDVDLIARSYHWPEATILALPQDRRRAYAERIRRAQARAA